MGSIFDKVGETITNLGNEVSSKTKSMVDVTNYQSQLRNCQNSLQSYYIEIGKTYYEQTKDAPAADMIDKFKKVEEAKEAIEHLGDAIRAAKGTIVCQSCGAEIVNTSVFCPKCGTKVDGSAVKANETVNSGICTKCGNTLKPGAAFCDSCGAKVEA